MTEETVVVEYEGGMQYFQLYSDDQTSQGDVELQNVSLPNTQPQVVAPEIEGLIPLPLDEPSATDENVELTPLSSAQMTFTNVDTTASDTIVIQPDSNNMSPPEKVIFSTNQSSNIIVSGSGKPTTIESLQEVHPNDENANQGNPADIQNFRMFDVNQLPPAIIAPLVEGEEPLFVNAKQYNRIMKRREARAKLEALGRLSKGRHKYQHQSRHKHAASRQRGPGGKFLPRKTPI